MTSVDTTLIRNTYCLLLCRFQRFEPFFRFNGDKEIRTLDPLLARQVLSQLSYTPKNVPLWNEYYTSIFRFFRQDDFSHFFKF